jgi:tetratricopeptide (TPR) repeat protein
MQTMTPATLIETIRATLSEKSSSQLAAYALIVGAGFSHGVVPLTKELLHERIGDFYYLHDMEGGERSSKEKQKLSRDYWKEFNRATAAAGEPVIELDRKGLPANPSVAYQQLFTYRTANTLFDSAPKTSFTPYLDSLKKYREALEPQPKAKALAGQQFVREFLQDVLDPGGYLSAHGAAGAKDWCTTGRSDLNAAHFFLASLLELQQSGRLWNLRPFCRTIFTTNFDTLLQNALQLANVLYCVTDRPERGLELTDFLEQDRALHLVYTHGTILRHNAASTTEELSSLIRKNARVISQYLLFRDVLVVGYGGWEDSLMSALAEGYHTGRRIYWCNVYPEDEAEDYLAPAVLDLFELYEGKAFYVALGRGGSDAFMAQLYRAIAPDGPIPRLLLDPLDVLGGRLRALKLENVNFAGVEITAPVRKLPLPRLERPARAMLHSASGVIDAARSCFGYRDQSGAIDKSYSLGQAQSLLERGFALALAGEDEKAVELWSRAVESATADFEDLMAGSCGVEAANYIGVVHCRAGRPELAVAAHTRAEELVYGSPNLKVKSLTYRGVAHQHAGDTELAMEDLSRAVAIWEDHPPAVDDAIAGRALVYRGLLREWAGDRPLAQQDFARARSLKQLSDECRELLSASADPDH